MLLKVCLFVSWLTFVSSNYSEFPEKSLQKTLLESSDKSRVGESYEPIEPGTVPYLMVAWTDSSISVDWTAPESSVTEFIVSLNDSTVAVPFVNSTETYIKVYDNVFPCTRYTAGVAVVNEYGTTGQFQSVNLTTLLPDSTRPVSNVSYTFHDNLWTISWDPPFFQKQCITKYEVLIQNPISQSTRTIVPPNTYYEEEFPSCTSGTLAVTPFIGQRAGAPLERFYSAPSRVLKAPTVVIVDVDSSVAILGVIFESFASNACQITHVRTQCSMDGAIWFAFIQPYYDDERRPSEILVIRDLAEDTTYTCQVLAINVAGNSDLSNPVVFTTTTTTTN